MPPPRSRCETAQDPPLKWHRYREADGSRPIDASLQEAVPDTLAKSERIARYAEIRSLMEQAAAGELEADPEDTDNPLKPVARDPDLWELRWSFSANGGFPTPGPTAVELWRMYHAEPHLAPKYLLALHFHRKSLDGGSAAIRAAQNSEIDLATSRFNHGRPWMWGLA